MLERFIYSIFIALLCISANAYAVSFDCRKFNTGVYKIICDSPELSKLDDELSSRYEAISKLRANDAVFKTFVMNALKKRGSCKDEVCLTNWYTNYIDVYKRIENEIRTNQGQAPNTSSTPSSIEQIVTLDLIGVQVAYLENKIGPAKRELSEGRTKEFQLTDGCYLMVNVDSRNRITGMEIDLTPKCNVNLASFIPGDEKRIMADELTVGEFEKIAGDLVYYADCLMMCGNAYEPRSYGVLKAEFDKYNNYWVLEGKYNREPHKYIETAREALKDNVIASVHIVSAILQQGFLTRDCK